MLLSLASNGNLCASFFPTYPQISSHCTSLTWIFTSNLPMMRSQFLPACSNIVSTVLGSTPQRRACGADAIAFQEAPQNHENSFLVLAYILTEGLLLRVRESFSALLALEPLEVVPAFPGLHHIGLAIVARHRANLLESREQKPDNGFGDSVRLRSRGFRPW